ncbi:hypothetical protein [Burkholderia cepacia]|uniref:hypothetical protein n=1 Tax=Burkholderia cepacia TaxID=292 RepID=UPI00075D17A4|nr:hypothetical protein [Burkholderia cepacia]KWH50741.1 hypothetical protein WM00_20785 [Burkholderia cepacia]
MSETIKKYVAVDPATGEDLYSYDNQAPTTALAKNISRSTRSPRVVVEERTYALVSKQTVRTLENGKRV